MPLSAGARLGVYEVTALIGEGGMGQVYRARDTTLNRDIALKILPDGFASDPDRLVRFTREAQTLAALNHPNIAHIHGLQQTGDVRALVMELVEGEDLAQQIAQGAIPLDEALPIAKQIAEALLAAHEQGIIHRDLKPANIKVRDDGTVKVLDFGLAKALEPPTVVGGTVTASPAITTPAMTQIGAILGTAAYMSPEQAKGRSADKRSDVWAFGCVFYEMLTGRRPFAGDDVSDTLAGVIKSDPDWNALPSTVPPSIRSLVEGCLKKDRRERIGDISTALFILNHPQVASTAAPARQPALEPVWRRAALVLVGVALGAGAAAGLWKLQASPAVEVTRFAIVLPPGQSLTTNNRQAVALSPDGTRIVYVSQGRLYLRSMSEIEARAMAGTDGASNPVFSPDGQSLVFWTAVDRTLKRIALSGGVPITICQIAVAPSGITWGDDGILFAQLGVGIMRVPPNGGQPERLVGLNGADVMQGPQMLPDGGTLLFTIAQGGGASAGDRWDHARIVAQSLKTGERKTLIEGGADGRYVPTGHLVYVLRGTLFAVPFNLAKLEVSAGPVPIIEGVRRVAAASVGTAHFVFSKSGSLVYLPGPMSWGREELFLFDRKGGAEALPLPAASYAYPRVSPDGKRLAFQTSGGEETIVAIYEMSGSSAVRRLTFGGNNRFPIWSADGQRVAFQSDRDGDRAVFWQSVDGGAAERLTTPEPGTSHVPESWSPSGEILLFNVVSGSTTSLWTLSVRDRKAMLFDDVSSTAYPTNAVFSPDGRWVAYQAGEASEGEATTYVQPFPPNGTKHQIARGGRPLWSRDGTELFYVPAAGEFRAVTVTTQPRFAVTNPVSVPRGFGIADPASPRPFDITPDGRIVGVGGEGQSTGALAAPTQIQVVLNWFEELKARVPIK